MSIKRTYNVGDGTCAEREIICEQCGIKFISNRPRSKYCSKKCRDKFWNKKYEPKGTYEFCVICGNEFYKYCRSKKTCSTKCSKKSRRINKNNKEKARKKNDVLYKMVYLLRGRLHSAVKKKSRSSLELLGCNLDELKIHLQKTALKNGYKDFDINDYNGHEYHIDHIKPCSSFNLLDEDEQRKCFHYSNLQILSKEENMRKYNKII